MPPESRDQESSPNQHRGRRRIRDNLARLAFKTLPGKARAKSPAHTSETSRQQPKPNSKVSLLGTPYMHDSFAAGADLLSEEQSVSTEVLDGLSAGDSVLLNCGFTRYRLVPTILPGVNASRLLTVIEAVDERKESDPWLPEGFIILVDGTSPMGGGLRPGELVRHGYLAGRMPIRVPEEEKSEAEKYGYHFVDGNIVVKAGGNLLINPAPVVAEMMEHMEIQKADGSSQPVF